MAGNRWPVVFKIEPRQRMKLKKTSRKKASVVFFGDAAPGTTVKHAGIGRSLGFLSKKFSEPIQLADLVKVSGMSRRGFSKAFQRNVGANPGAVLRHIRIEHAKRLLVEDDLSLKQLARRCGYRSENTFCVAFRRSTKMSPKKFQRQHWLGIYRRQNRRPGELVIGFSHSSFLS